MICKQCAWEADLKGKKRLSKKPRGHAACKNNCTCQHRPKGTLINREVSAGDDAGH